MVVKFLAPAVFTALLLNATVSPAQTAAKEATLERGQQFHRDDRQPRVSCRCSSGSWRSRRGKLRGEGRSAHGWWPSIRS